MTKKKKLDFNEAYEFGYKKGEDIKEHSDFPSLCEAAIREGVDSAYSIVEDRVNANLGYSSQEKLLTKETKPVFWQGVYEGFRALLIYTGCPVV